MVTPYLGGFGNIGFNYPSQLSDEQRFWFLDPEQGFGRSYQAMLNPYLQRYGQHSSFTDYLQGQGRRDAQTQYDALSEQYALNNNLSQLPDFLQFFKTAFNPSQSYGSLSPRDRGENPAMQSPFTRYIGRF